MTLAPPELARIWSDIAALEAHASQVDDRLTELRAERVAAMTSCGCFTCLDKPDAGWRNPILVRFIVCPKCGNKRCPRATNHEHACTKSNEPGQSGSRYTGWTADVTSPTDKDEP